MSLPKLNFSLTQIEYVLAVHRLGHFAKAAEACFVTQPTLSMQIQKLEQDLGAVLFDRSKKPILLTQIGKQLIEQFQETLNAAKKINEIVTRNVSGEIQGDLRVGVIPTLAPYLIPRVLPTLEKLSPKLSLRLSEYQTAKLLQALEDDEVDVGLLATPVAKPQVHEIPLFYEPFSVLCRRDHPLAGSKRIRHSSLKYDDIWLLEEGHCLRNQVVDVCALKPTDHMQRKFQFASGSLETVKNLVNRYGGFTLLPALACEDLGTRSELIPFERPIPAREIGLVHRREHYKLELIEAFGQALLQCLPEEIRKLRPRDLAILPVE